jgi:hypothetical protein
VTAEQQEVDVVIHQYPGEDFSPGCFHHATDAGEKILPILIITKDRKTFDSLDHHMV